MARHTRTPHQRRLDAYNQRQRERDLRQLAGELRLLWWQRGTNNSAGQDAGSRGYVDPKLVLWSQDGA